MDIEMTRFDKFLEGLKALQPFAFSIDFDSIKRSSPFSGEPEHSYSSYCIVEVYQERMWAYLEEDKDFVKRMGALGWKSEQEDGYWIFE